MALDKWVLVAPLAALCVNVAEAGNYIGIDWTSLNIENTANEDLNPNGLRARLGIRFGDTFDLEAHWGRAEVDDSSTYKDFSVQYSGAYLKAYMPFGQRSAFYGLGGVARMEYEQTINGQKLSIHDSDFSYGFGLETQLTRYIDLSADYMKYAVDIGDFSGVSGWNVGLKWYF